MRRESSSPPEGIAIVGIGCRFPGGANTPQAFWRQLKAGVDAVAEVPADRVNLRAYLDPEPGKAGKTCSTRAALLDAIDQFDPQFFGISPREAALVDPQQRLLLEATWEAFEDAGQPMDTARTGHVGVFVGISTNDYAMMQTSGDIAVMDGYATTGSTMSIAANRISYCFNFQGPCLAVDTACSSSLVALHLACRALAAGECELAVTAGVNAIIAPYPFLTFSSMGMLSPDGRCKAFDARANGFVRGEGVGAILLKPLQAALAAGDTIYAVIRSTNVNQDGRTPGISVPSQAAQQRLVLDACEAAGVEPGQVQYVEAHGTGTPVGDPIEANALGMALSRGRAAGDTCLIGSVKTNIGHLEAAAGIAGVIKTALALQHGMVPPSLHFERANPRIDFAGLKLQVAQSLTPLRTGTGPVFACVNSFGWGGTNAHALLENPPVTQPRRQTEAGAWVIPVSARSPETLVAAARAYRDLLLDADAPALGDISYSAAIRRPHVAHRIALAGTTAAELARQFDEFARGEGPVSPGVPADPGKIAFVFSGQGPQWWRMGRDLFEREPVFRSVIEECDGILQELGGWSLITELTRDESTCRLDRTAIAQPAIFSLQVALAALWRSWGIVPDAVVGHSVGEVAAACVAGVLDLREAARVIYERGRTMDLVTTEGGMLALGLTAGEAQPIIDAHPGRVFLAAENGPASVTLSGDPSALRSVAASLEARSVFTRLVPVQYAFHSAQMDPVEPELRRTLNGVSARSATLAFASTVTGQLARGPELDAAYWWRNVRETVRFRAGIDCLVDQGCRIFVELSPHPVLGAAVRECLSQRGERGLVLSSLQRGADDRIAMRTALCALHSAGHPVNWNALFPDGGTWVRLPGHPMQRERFWSEPESSQETRLAAIPHPFLARRVPSADACWQVTLDRRAFPYLDDHRVQGRILFPAAGFVEMALAAAREVFGPGSWVLEDVDLLKALFLSETDEAPVLQLTHYAADSSFAIRSRARSSSRAWITHATGKIRMQPIPASASRAGADLGAIRQRCPTEGSGAQLYEQLAACGLQYGPAFQGVEAFQRRDGESLARVHSPLPPGKQDARYILHPSYLDACLQASFAALPEALSKGDAGVWLPVHFDRLQVFAPPESASWVHSEGVLLDPRTSSGTTRVLDADGRVSVALMGFRTRLVEGANQRRDDWCYELTWQRTPLPSVEARRTPEFLPATASLTGPLQHVADQLDASLGITARSRELEADVDALCSAHVLHAFAALGWKPRGGEQVTLPGLMRRMRIAPRYEPLLSRYLDHLTDDGVLGVAASGDAWLVQRAAPRFDRARAWRSLLARHAAFAQELILIDRCGAGLSGVLRGDVDPLQLIFPRGSISALEQFYADGAMFRVPNAIVQEAIARALANRPEGRKVRIVELGGGTGGTTMGVLSRLPAEEVDYLFTDVSSSFFGAAEQKFQDYSFVRYEVLDIERSPEAQGFEPHCADIVIAADVLHATVNLDVTLANVRQLIAPGGLLVLMEVDRAPRWFDLVFGLLDGWWKFSTQESSSTDPAHARHGSPLLTHARWRQVLKAGGFVEAEAVRCGDQAVLLAREPLVHQDALQPAVSVLPDSNTRWLLFDDGGRAADDLASVLTERGNACVVVPASVCADADGAGRVWTEFAGTAGPHAVVHFTTLEDVVSNDAQADAIEAACLDGCSGLLHLVQALARSGDRDAPQLFIVTRGAQPAGTLPRPLALTAAPLIGLARVIRAEHPDLRVKAIDLGPAAAADEGRVLLAELTAGDHEHEIAWRGEARYARRLTRATPSQSRAAGQLVDPAGHPGRLEIQKPGQLDRLTVHPLSRRSLEPDEVEIEVVAAGLNFRDVMKALGVYPTEAGDATVLGDECAGRIVRIGRNVQSVRVGDAVMALAPGSLASHVITRAAVVFPKPAAMSFEEAATLLVAYLTAAYALQHLGRMQRGERVLIHAAAGGVGCAALQVAQQVGAEIFATAGTEEKRDFLRACGVRHVMDSRSLSFAEEVMALTGGQGVDLVLNSLAGEAIPKGLAILAPYGRFLEIGKRDIYENSQIGLRPFRKNLSYFAVDLGDALRARSLDRIAGGVRRQLATGRLRPLPYRSFPLANASGAFRYIAQAKQIGKVIVRVAGESVALQPPPPPSRLAVQADATYLVTGGLGGFGLAVAQWLVSEGARHIVLMGRRAVLEPEAQDTVASMEQLGAKVVVARGDVGREDDMRRVLGQISETLPPLRGVVHAAMLLDDGLLTQLDAGRFRSVMAPKVRGAWHLHALTLNQPLDFFILFSSAAAVIGNPGQGNYVAANAFLDALAHHRQAMNLPALSVNWGYVSDAGYVSRTPKVREHFARIGWTGMAAKQALDVLGRLVPSRLPQVTVARIDWSAVPVRITSGPTYSMLMAEGAAGAAAAHDTESIRETVLRAAPDEGRRIIADYLKEQVAKVLRISSARLSADKALTELGLDSLLAVELVNRLESQLGVSLPTSKLMGGPTISRLADALLETLTGAGGSARATPDAVSSGEVVDLARDILLDPAITFATDPALAAQFTHPSAIFLTGTAGLLNAHLIRDLVRQTTADLHCLITAPNLDEAHRRIAAECRTHGVAVPQERIVPVLGALDQPLFGLTPPAFADLAARVDAVLHCGAQINQVAAYAQLKAANVTSVQTAVRLATEVRQKPLHYVSSLAVLSARTDVASERVMEDDALTNPENLLGGYAQSRWAAEKILSAARARGLVVNVYRPGLPLGPASNGAGVPDDVMWRLLKTCLELNAGPAMEMDSLLTPVDYISASIVHLSAQPELEHRTFHLAHPRPRTIADLLRCAQSFGYPLEIVPNAEWQRRLTALAAKGPENALLPYLLLLPGAMLDTLIGTLSVPLIDGRRARAGLAGAGVDCAPLDDAVLHAHYSDFIRAGFFPPLPENDIGSGFHRPPSNAPLQLR